MHAIELFYLGSQVKVYLIGHLLPFLSDSYHLVDGLLGSILSLISESEQLFLPGVLPFLFCCLDDVGFLIDKGSSSFSSFDIVL